jgi:mRNA interferase MazF
MRRGEVWWVTFDHSTGGEIRKTRPAVVVSNDAANAHANRVQVVPVSSKTGKLYPCEALVTVRGVANKAMADQIMTVSKSRLTECIERLSSDELRQVERVIRLQLCL